jgi:glycosyltransferase involved in cell wall biosynthesis
MNFGGLRVLMISTDRNILVPGSSVLDRMLNYGTLVEELHIVLLSDSKHGLKQTQLGRNVWVYPTNSLFKFLRPYSAASIGKSVVYDRKFVRGKSVITAQDPFESGLAGLKVKNKWRLPLEVQLHTDPFSPLFSGRLNKVRLNIARKVLPNADGVRVVNNDLKKKVEENFGVSKERITVLPIFVDKEKFENTPIKFDLHSKFNWRHILLCVGRLAPEKNFNLALRVIQKLKENFESIGLVIVGSGPEESNLKKAVRELGISNNVAFVGWEDDLISYYKTASVFLQTSDYEGYGMALVEAALSGIPIVTTKVGVANEFQNGVELCICPAGDIECFSSTISSLLENNFKRENLQSHMKEASKD